MNKPTSNPAIKKPKKGIYLLPSMVTLGALFAGFYAIIMAMNGNFTSAVVGILAAALLDGLDGRIARLTNTQSAFGEQMDSLSDMVSFGAAPALIIYTWALQPIGRWGWIAAFIYCACAALRLARFNVNTSVIDKRFFQGLPSPGAAALLIGFVGLIGDSSISPINHYDLAWPVFALTIFAGLSMITNIPFYSFKDFHSQRSVPFIFVVVFVLVVALISIDPYLVLWLIFLIYSISGYVVYAWKKFKGQPTSVISISIDEPDERGLHVDDDEPLQ